MKWPAWTVSAFAFAQPCKQAAVSRLINRGLLHRMCVHRLFSTCAESLPTPATIRELEAHVGAYGASPACSHFRLYARCTPVASCTDETTYADLTPYGTSSQAAARID
jgi:hypothetical protein